MAKQTTNVGRDVSVTALAVANPDLGSGATLPGAGTAPTLDPAVPDNVADVPVTVAAPIGRDVVVERVGVDAAGHGFVEQPTFPVEAIRPGTEGVPGSLDGVNGRGTVVESDRVRPTGMDGDHPTLAEIEARHRTERDLTADGRFVSLEIGNAISCEVAVSSVANELDRSFGRSAVRAALQSFYGLDVLGGKVVVDDGVVLVSCTTRRRRGGLAFGPTPVPVRLAELKPDQVEAIEGDPMLTIRRVRSESGGLAGP